MATASTRVKITNLPVNISEVDLAKELTIDKRQVGIPKNQPDPNKWYAWISRFDSEQEANEFVSRWNDTIHFGKKMTCKVSSTMNNQSSTIPKSFDNRSRFANTDRLRHRNETHDRK